MSDPTSKSYKCVHCGNNPTNHLAHYISSVLALLMEPVDRSFARIRIGKRMKQKLSLAESQTLNLLSSSRVVSLYTDKTKSPSRRGMVIWEEAERRGIPVEGIAIFDKPIDVYRAYLPEGPKVYANLPFKDSMRVESRIDDKLFLKNFLREASIPVPQGKSVWRFSEALRVFESLEKPVIVKPRTGSRGRHTVTHISTQEDLEFAFKVAKKLNPRVIVEEHLLGSVYRGTVIGKKLVGVLKGDPPRVVGDGKKTILELIREKNLTRPEVVAEVAITPLLRNFLRRAGFDFDSVPSKGTEVDLSEKIGLGYGGSSKEIVKEIHPHLRVTLEKAAKILDTDILGFDFIIPDPTQDPRKQRWGIIECNTAPFIDLHHFPLLGEPVNVAKHVWDLLVDENNLLK